MSKDITTLTDLHSAAPFTYVETYYDIENCSSDPFVFQEWRTVYVGGSTYPGKTATITVETNTLVTYTFPDLILTLLHPGAIILMVCP